MRTLILIKTKCANKKRNRTKPDTVNVKNETEEEYRFILKDKLRLRIPCVFHVVCRKSNNTTDNIMQHLTLSDRLSLTTSLRGLEYYFQRLCTSLA